MQKRVLRASAKMLVQLPFIDIKEQLRLENEYLRNENHVLTHQFKVTGKRLIFTDAQRRDLAIKAKALGRRMAEVVTIVRSATILAWQATGRDEVRLFKCSA